MAVLQHAPFEDPAAIAFWAAERGMPVTVSHLHKGEPLPDPSTFDMLTVMGGPTSANDEAELAWLGPEIALVHNAIKAKKIVLGVCLGAQIIAKSLGARVYAGPQKEIGWFPVRRTESSHPLFDGLPAEFIPLHWHGETFDLPNGAERLAETPVTANQAFAVGKRVLGLQFHMEATEASVTTLVENAAGDIGDGPFVQRPSTILAGLAHCAVIRSHLDRVLDNLTGFARAGK